MSISEDNLISIQSSIRNLNTFTLSLYPNAKQLRAYTQVGNAEIFRHLCFELPPPTWHAGQLGDNVTSDTATDSVNPFRLSATPSSHAAFAKHNNFRTQSHPPHPTDTTENSSHAGAATAPTPPGTAPTNGSVSPADVPEDQIYFSPLSLTQSAQQMPLPTTPLS